MRIDDNDVPHIEGECAACGFVFDLGLDAECPTCHYIGVSWARLAKNQTYPGKLSSPYPLSEGDYADIAELDRMYAMEDPR